MDDVQVLVKVFWCGSVRKEIVTVPEEAFVKQCWKPIAAMKAAALMEIPFTDVERLAKYGLRPEDKQRLIQAAGATDGETGGQIARATEEVQNVS